MRFSLRVLLPFSLVLAACTSQPVPPSDLASSSSSLDAASSQASSLEDLGMRSLHLASHSGSYVNAQYGFSFEYPKDFEPVTSIAPRPKGTQRVLENNVMVYKGSLPSLLALDARDRTLPGFELFLNVYPMAGYTYTDIYNDEYAYDPASVTWKALMANTPFKPQSTIIDGTKAYLFRTGDAGNDSRITVIPLKDRQVMLEVGITSCPGCSEVEIAQKTLDANVAHIDRETKLILTSLKLFSVALHASSSAAAVSSSAHSIAYLPRLPLAQRHKSYTNTRFGFSLLIPTYLSRSPSQCEYAPFPEHGYPVKVMEDGDMTYVTPALYGDLQYDNARSSYGPCVNVDVTLDTIQKDMFDKIWYYQGWKMVGKKGVASKADLLSFIREWFGAGCGIKATKESGHPGTLDVQIDGNESDLAIDEGSLCPLNFLYAVKYSPAKQEAVLWKIGQDGRFEDMDMDMAKSFRFN